ncbi:hypothetical protein GCM10011575_47330 [Microlunatus endophyticus]|uniref:Uncharacterized protein n=1 Tax=Microlunatus endophyticus TaxID=1716077 RepID=A0A917SK26_9ACTN|nr:hypothetical protein GCM10011575_47330 [Microlunatus endophyticus]
MNAAQFEVVPRWPRCEAVTSDDGTGYVIVGGLRQEIAGIDDAALRAAVVDSIRHRAADLCRPLRVSARTPAGDWQILINPDGTVEDDSTGLTSPSRRRSVARLWGAS